MTFVTAYTAAPWIAAGLNIALVLWVSQTAPAGSVKRAFLFWTAWMALWNIAVAVGCMLPDADAALSWYKFFGAPISRFTAPIFLHFVCALTETLPQRNVQRVLRWSYALACLLVGIGCTTSFLMAGVQHYYWGYYPLAGPGDWTYGLYFSSVVGYAFVLLRQKWREAQGPRSQQLALVFWGAVIGFVSGFTNFLPLYGFSIYPIGNLMNSLYALLVAYAIIEYGFMNIQLALRRGAVYAILSGAMTAVYLSIVAVLQKVFGHYGIEEHVAFYTAAFPLTVVLAPTMKSRIEPLVDQTFFRGSHYDIARSREKNQEMTLMGVLAMEMAHELTKPLTHIMNVGSELETQLKGRSRENIRTIEKEVQRASEILDGFAMLSPERTLHRIAVPLPDLMEESLAALGLDQPQTIRLVRRYKDLPPVWVNPGQIVQVLTNLIQNATQAMTEGGTLTLSLRGAGKGNIFSAVEMSVSDTGHGIPPDIQKDVFRPFFTTKETSGGRGMGLTISHAMVERHGGTISIESPTKGSRGTRVTVRLPMHSPGGTS